MARSLVVFILVQSLLLVAAQTVTVLAPADTSVAPGATLVLPFELTASADVNVDVEAISGSGWTVSAAPASIALQADVAATVNVTVTVPDDATAFAVDEVTLRLTGVDPVVERTVVLTVLEVIDLRLEAPSQAPIGPGGLRVVVVNAGNGDDVAPVELLRDGEALARHEVPLAAGERVEVRFDLPDEGRYEVRLSNGRGVDDRRQVRGLRFGAPPPTPLALSGAIAAAYGYPDDWSGTISLSGPLSDYTELDLRVDAPSWRRSYLELGFDAGNVRVGAGGTPPFGLDLPKDFVVAGTYEEDGLGVAASVGITSTDRLVAVGAGSWTAPDFAVALGGGLRDGEPLAALRTRYAGPATSVELTARYRDDAIAARLTTEVRTEGSTTTLRLDAQGLLTSGAKLGGEARLRAGTTTVYANVTAPLQSGSSWTWRAGLTDTIPTAALPSGLQVALQAGSSESFGRVSFRTDLPGDWRTSHTAGVRYDTTGFGLTLDTAWTWDGAAEVGLDARLQYYPALQRVDGKVRATLDVASDEASLGLEGDWNLSNDSVGLKANMGLGADPWVLDVEGAVRYAYTNASDPWTYDVGVDLTYAFDVAVPATVVEATGGRRLGTLTGRVVADDLPLAGVVVEIGRFRVLTDALGAFELYLPPGTYDVSIDLSSLPPDLRATADEATVVEIVARAAEDVLIDVAGSAP